MAIIGRLYPPCDLSVHPLSFPAKKGRPLLLGALHRALTIVPKGGKIGLAAVSNRIRGKKRCPFASSRHCPARSDGWGVRSFA